MADWKHTPGTFTIASGILDAGAVLIGGNNKPWVPYGMQTAYRMQKGRKIAWDMGFQTNENGKALFVAAYDLEPAQNKPIFRWPAPDAQQMVWVLIIDDVPKICGWNPTTDEFIERNIKSCTREGTVTPMVDYFKSSRIVAQAAQPIKKESFNAVTLQPTAVNNLIPVTNNLQNLQQQKVIQANRETWQTNNLKMGNGSVAGSAPPRTFNSVGTVNNAFDLNRIPKSWHFDKFVNLPESAKVRCRMLFANQSGGTWTVDINLEVKAMFQPSRALQYIDVHGNVIEPDAPYSTLYKVEPGRPREINESVDSDTLMANLLPLWVDNVEIGYWLLVAHDFMSAFLVLTGSWIADPTLFESFYRKQSWQISGIYTVSELFNIDSDGHLITAKEVISKRLTKQPEHLGDLKNETDLTERKVVGYGWNNQPNLSSEAMQQGAFTKPGSKLFKNKPSAPTKRTFGFKPKSEDSDIVSGILDEDEDKDDDLNLDVPKPRPRTSRATIDKNKSRGLTLDTDDDDLLTL